MRAAWVGLGVLAVLAVLVVGEPAGAIAKCKAKVDKKTGEIVVNASSVSNNPLWGPTPDQVLFAFDDPVACFTGGKLKGCRLASPGSPYRTMPPERCAVYIADDGPDDCTAVLPSCTPGVRPGIQTGPIDARATASDDALQVTAENGYGIYAVAPTSYAMRVYATDTNEQGAIVVQHYGPEGNAVSIDVLDEANPRAALFAQTEGPGFSGWFEVGSGGSGTALFARSTSGSASAEAARFVGPVSTLGNVDIDGNLNVDGTLTKDAGAFRIDHPLDPENRWLSHSFVESPDMMNVYNGNAKLGAGGRAVVTMPEWFEALNRDFRYQLTPIGAPGPDLHVAKQIAENRFEIAGGAPGMLVSWQVTGVRRDAYANAHRIAVEEEKSLAERGTTSHPELYGRNEPAR
jgi:hypothetical protein